jgi:RNA polymerase sigma-70 factor (ECF subfamily)
MFAWKSHDGPPSPATDEALMLRYRGGDQQAFRKLYERHRAPLLRFVRRTAADRSDVDEIVQETWVAVIRGRQRYTPQARFVTYLYTIARRRGVDRWRRRGRRSEFEDSGTAELVAAPSHSQPESLFRSQALAAAIAAALDSLPLLQKEAVLLRTETDLTLEEIAQVTGTSRETAKSRLRYGLGRLRQLLAPWT